MHIVLDAMGSDTCPEPEIQAAVEASQLFKNEIILVGPGDLLKSRLQSMAVPENVIRIVDAPETITMLDKGMALALKAKRRNSKTSMAVGMDLPVKDGTCIVLDIGANPDCKPEHLVQFAIMGSIYAKKARTISNPRVAILSNGEEAGKGNELVRDTFPLLQESGLNFIGNVEGKELFAGNADVVVTDGFTGNILLKSTEAVAKLIMDIMREQLKSNAISMIGGMLARPALVKVKALLNPDEYGAAPLLGVNGLVFIGHGRSNAQALMSAIKLARASVEANLLSSIKIAIEESVLKSTAGII
jgi:glycerol-3-phosphate acyltransferase PlsX